jgi:hypothetical protein
MFGLPSAETTDVELELLALKDVTVGAAGLTGAGRDDGVKATGSELGLKKGVDLGLLLTLSNGALDVVGLLVGIVGDGGKSLLGLRGATERSRRWWERRRKGDDGKGRSEERQGCEIGVRSGKRGIRGEVEFGSFRARNGREGVGRTGESSRRG